MELYSKEHSNIYLRLQVTGIKEKDLYSPLRLSLFGSPHGPDIPLLIEILGIDETLNRLRQHI